MAFLTGPAGLTLFTSNATSCSDEQPLSTPAAIYHTAEALLHQLHSICSQYVFS